MKAPLLPFALLLILTNRNLHAQPDPTLVGYYSFCNCNANDNSGNNNHGTLVGVPDCTDGQRGQGFLFNQTTGNNGCGQTGGEYVRLPNFGAIWANGFTVCAWVRFDNEAYYERILDFGNASGDAGGMPIWFGREGATNNLALESWISGDGSLNRTVGRLVAPNAIANGSIEYYCATISGNTMRIYVNGVLKAEKTGHPILNVPRQNNFLGRSNWCHADPDFKGFMDEVRVYNRALSAAEINSLYLQTPTFGAFQSPVSPGTPVQLSAQGGVQYQWSPAASLNNPTVANPIATPAQTTTYYCTITLPDGCIYTDSLVVEVTQAACMSQCAGRLGDNIFPDGDFGAGIPEVFPFDPGIAPGYLYTTSPPPNDGFYCLANNTSSWGSFAAGAWINIQDNGPEPNGYMMVVNASNQPGVFYQKTVNVCENTVYELSVDVISLLEPVVAGQIRPNLSFLINGSVVCTTGDVPNDQSWRTYRLLFETAPGQTSVTLAIRNNAPGGNGNDLALDNISFRACGPEITLPALVDFCSGAPVRIDAVLNNSPYANTVLQWQSFVGGQWVDIPNAQGLFLELPNPAAGQRVRLLAANSAGNLDQPNCRVASEAVTLIQRPDLQPVVQTASVRCIGLSDGSASASVSNGVPPYIYAWSNGATSADIGSLSPGTYTLTVTDARGCTGLSAATITEPDLLTVAAALTDIACFGAADGAIAAAVSGGIAPYNYTWNTGQTAPVLAGLAPGGYALTVTDQNNCTAVFSGQITQPPALTLSVATDAVACFGGTDGRASASAAGGVPPYAYNWSNGGSGAVNSGLPAGTFTVSLTDANGCQIQQAVQIAQPAALTLLVATDAVACFGGTDGRASASAAGGVPPYAYNWSNGGSDAVNNGLPAGTFTVSLTDANGCQIQQAVQIAQPAALDGQYSAVQVRCFGNSDGAVQADIAGGTPPYNYVWSHGAATAQSSGLPAGGYAVTVTDAEGCTLTGALAVTEPPILALPVLSAESVSCFGGADGVATASPAGGVPPYAYSWSNGGSGAVNSGLSAGTFSVSVTDANGCQVQQTVQIIQPSALSGQFSAVNARCFGNNDGVAQADVAGGTPPYSYAWSHGAATAQATGLLAGGYAVTVTDAEGCTLTGAVTVTEPPLLILSAFFADSVSCFDGTDGRASAGVAGGTPPYLYAWSNGGTGAVNDQLPAGAYTLSVTDANGCTLSQSLDVPQPPVLSGQFTTDSVTCNGDQDGAAYSSISGGAPPYGYAWSNGLAGAQLIGLFAGPYDLTVTDAKGCTLVATIPVPEPERLNLFTVLNNVSCRGIDDGLIEAQAAGGIQPYVYLWNTGSANPLLTNLSAGDYLLTVTDARGCSISAFTQLTEKLTPSATLGLDTEVVLGEELELTAETNFPAGKIESYLWMRALDTLLCEACDTYRFQPLQDGCVSLEVRNTAGCLATAEVCYKILPLRRVYFPNVFSPNSDQLNDFFTVYTDASVIQVRYLSIFDRWGGLVFRREKFNPGQDDLGWDGTRLGDTLQNGVFAWMAELEFIDGVVKRYSGDVTILR